MKKKKLSAKTCYLMGVCGTGVQLLAGIIITAGFGAATYLHVAALALLGGMLLFLAVAQTGAGAKNRRLRLMGLFLLLVAGWVIPVPVGSLLNAFVLPILLRMYGREGDTPTFVLLLVAELTYAVAYTLAITGFTGGFRPTLVLGVGLAAVAVCRAVALLRLYRHAVGAPPPEGENPLR